MTETPILDESAVSEIEARRARCLDNKNQSRLAEASILIASDIPALCATVKHLRAQLPAEMQDCTILFKKCPRGHGWLTATNWIRHDCQQCAFEQLQAKSERNCGEVEGNSVAGGCGISLLVSDGFRCADCLAYFHRDCINEHFKLDAYVKKLRELREQGAIDDWKKQLADLQSQLEQLRAERETLIYWLLRAYQSGHREGWEPGASTDETMDGICSVLANRGYDPNLSNAAKELLKTKPKF